MKHLVSSFLHVTIGMPKLLHAFQHLRKKEYRLALKSMKNAKKDKLSYSLVTSTLHTMPYNLRSTSSDRHLPIYWLELSNLMDFSQLNINNSIITCLFICLTLCLKQFILVTDKYMHLY